MQKYILEKIINVSKQLKEKIILDRRHLHTIPEVGFELKETINYIKKRLKEINVSYRDIGRSGLVATVGEGDKTVLLRADVDALPLKENSGVAFAAQNGNMHACGHDMHAAMLLGAIEIIKRIEKLFCGRIVFAFQPAEETLEGAADMIKAGLISEYAPDMAMMIHAILGTPLEAGTAIVASPGIGSPGAKFFRISVRGTSAHGATPHLGKNVILPMSHIMIAAEAIPIRDFSPSDNLVLSFGMVNAGSYPNVIPDSAKIEGTIRAYNEKTISQACECLRRYCYNVAAVYDCSAAIDFPSGCPPLKSDEYVSKVAYETAVKILGKSKVHYSDELGGNGGSEDFSHIASKVPSVLVGLSAGNVNKGYNYPLHNSKALFDEETLLYGAQLYAGVAINYLGKT